MMTLRAGAAGSKAAARAMAAYLQEKQVSDDTLRAAEYYGRTEGAEEAIAAGQGCTPTPRADMAPEVAKALGVDPARPLTTEQLANLLGGQRADGADLEGHRRGVGTYDPGEGSDAKVRYETAYLDLTLSAPKGVSVAWALAGTDAERNSLLQAHRTAVAETLRYVEEQIGWARMGAGGQGGRERARFGWVTCDHYTARPTLECVRTDPETGEAYTELRSLAVTGDPQLHSHNIVPNVMVTESGRTVALDTQLFHGRFHEFGAVYQALLARELRAMGVDVELDERTKLARLPAVPEWVCDEFSKRHRDAEGAARARARETGVDYDALSGEDRSAFLAYGARSTRQEKESNKPDRDAWREQAERIGWRSSSVVAYGPPAPGRTHAERMAEADRAGLPHLAEMLTKRAVIGQGDARLAAARGFIAAGIEGTDDLGAMMRHWAAGGIQQDGQWTRLLWQEGERGRVKLTTELHRDQETELIRLARSAVADRTHTLTPGEIVAAVERSDVSYRGEHGRAQRTAVEALGTDGGLAVMIGTAGSGKTKGVLPPLVAAWQARGLEVWGVAQAWRQANELEGAGIKHCNTRALQPFLDGVEAERTPLDGNSVVVVDELGQIGTRQLLHLLRLREQHGFKVAAVGDDRQCQSIEAGPVIELLRRALGEERIPEILTTVRQLSEEERRIAGLFRDGKAAEAIAAKREDNTAELAPGGYRAAIERVADLYAERRRATHNQGPDYRITISAPTNVDAREISRAVRERRREMGEVGADQVDLAATDGRGNGYTLALAAGDNVRLFERTRAVFTDERGRRKSANIGDNGSVLRVEAVLPAEGLMLRGESGKTGFVSWAALQERGGTGRLLLGYGDCLTIDSSQGITSDEHINALPAGSRAVQGFKAYVAESRHRVRSWLVGSMGAEMREARERRPAGLPELTPEQVAREAWGNLVRNLEKQPAKESALAFLERATAGKRETAKVFQGTLRRHEVRVAAGESATTLRRTAQAKQVRAALPRIAEGIEQAARQRAVVAASLRAMPAYWADKERRRVEVAARLVAEGKLPFREAAERIVAAELADERRGLAPDPIPGTHRLPKGTKEVDQVERRIGVRLMAVIDAYKERQAEASAAPAPRATERQGAAASA